MDGGAWQAVTVHGVSRVRHDLATKPPYYSTGFPGSISSKKKKKKKPTCLCTQAHNAVIDNIHCQLRHHLWNLSCLISEMCLESIHSKCV